MKKIMFNDRYGLTQAVLEGRKTMTRRRAKEQPCFEIGEIVAIAQSYFDIGKPQYNRQKCSVMGNTNKMFVRAELMPHHIKITDVRVEHLQEITEEDCIREGIMEGEFTNTWDRYYYDFVGDVAVHITFPDPLAAFAQLINKVTKEGTWELNPLVEVYSFELVD